MTYDCMTPAELTLWQEAAIYDGEPTAKKPCVDCPMWFHLQEKAAGRCSSSPSPNGGREALFDDPEHAIRRERRARRREQMRQYAQAYRARQRGSQAPRIGAQ